MELRSLSINISHQQKINGSELWTSYSIPLPPKATGELNNMGVEILAPSGVPVWNSPTFDTARNLIYYGTGEAYSSPAADTSDSVIAINKVNGDIEWVYQAESGDAWNMGCFVEADANCILHSQSKVYMPILLFDLYLL